MFHDYDAVCREVWNVNRQISRGINNKNSYSLNYGGTVFLEVPP